MNCIPPFGWRAFATGPRPSSHDLPKSVDQQSSDWGVHGDDGLAVQLMTEFLTREIDSVLSRHRTRVGATTEHYSIVRDELMGVMNRNIEGLSQQFCDVLFRALSPFVRERAIGGIATELKKRLEDISDEAARGVSVAPVMAAVEAIISGEYVQQDVILLQLDGAKLMLKLECLFGELESHAE